MAITTTISSKELQRQAGLAFEGKSFKLFLANNTAALTAESLASEWLAAELSGSGYAAITGTIAAGEYKVAEARFEMPAITGVFQADGGTLTFNSVCLYLTGEQYLHSVTVESPTVILSSGQTKAYTLTLAQDD